MVLRVLRAMEKTCTKCGAKKPLEAFRVDRSTLSGHKQPCKRCSCENLKNWVKTTEAGRQWQKRQRFTLRKQVLAAYGSRCVCCGESTPEFLTIDHIQNAGAVHRKEIGKGDRLEKWRRKHAFPKDNFQLLCFNCNCAKGIYGECPHQKMQQPAA